MEWNEPLVKDGMVCSPCKRLWNGMFLLYRIMEWNVPLVKDYGMLGFPCKGLWNVMFPL